MDQFRNIGLIGRLGSVQVIDTVRRINKFLSQQGYSVILDDGIANVMPGHSAQVSR